MIQKITFVNHKSKSLDVLLDGNGSNGLILVSMDGIGPVKGDINTTELVTSDGAIFNTARVNTRNIQIQFKLLANPTMEATRKKLYSFFGVKKPVVTRIYTELRELEIDGYVESNEISVFTNSEIATISIICPNPYFHRPLNLTTKFEFENPDLEFPYNSSSGKGELSINNNQPIIFGEVVIHDWDVLDYEGDGDTGVIVSMYITGIVKNPKVVNRNTKEMIKIDTDKLNSLLSTAETTVTSHLIAGDKIIIDTNVSSKSVTLIRAGVKYNILNCIDRKADWFVITSGENVFVTAADEGESHIILYLETKILYEGV